MPASALNNFYKGETLTFNTEVRRKSNNELFDPTEVSIVISTVRQKASDVVIVKLNTTMTKTSTGVYYADWTSDASGSYEVVYKVTDGSRITIGKGTFKIV